MARTLDENMQRVTALPAQNASNESASVDLGADRVGPVGDALEAHLELPATPDLADGETITLSIEDSADDASFAALETLGTLVVTGAGGAGAAAKKLRFYLPPDCRRYVRAAAAASTTAGDNTGVDYTLNFRV